jgi:hypothetical protein
MLVAPPRHNLTQQRTKVAVFLWDVKQGDLVIILVNVLATHQLTYGNFV